MAGQCVMLPFEFGNLTIESAQGRRGWPSLHWSKPCLSWTAWKDNLGGIPEISRDAKFVQYVVTRTNQRLYTKCTQRSCSSPFLT